MVKMPEVSCRYGAPMGRSTWGSISDIPHKSAKLYKVPLDSGGYDNGGAYWGVGLPLWCAEAYCPQADDIVFYRFARAWTRQQAATDLGLNGSHLIRARGVA